MLAPTFGGQKNAIQAQKVAVTPARLPCWAASSACCPRWPCWVCWRRWLHLPALHRPAGAHAQCARKVGGLHGGGHCGHRDGCGHRCRQCAVRAAVRCLAVPTPCHHHEHARRQGVHRHRWPGSCRQEDGRSRPQDGRGPEEPGPAAIAAATGDAARLRPVCWVGAGHRGPVAQAALPEKLAGLHPARF